MAPARYDSDVGAYDWIDEYATCPHCGLARRCSVSFDFRFPAHWECARLRPGEWHPIRDDRGTILEPINAAGFVRFRAVRAGPIAVIASDLNHFTCSCGTPLAVTPVVQVNDEQDRLALRELRLIDATLIGTAAPRELAADYACESNFACPTEARDRERYLAALTEVERIVALGRGLRANLLGAPNADHS